VLALGDAARTESGSSLWLTNRRKSTGKNACATKSGNRGLSSKRDPSTAPRAFA